MATHDVTDSQLPTGAGSAAEVRPVPAASTIVLRGERPFEILLMRRHEKSTFVPGAWVFPGGALEEIDRADDELQTMRNCAVRELREETGVTVPSSDELVLTARWITPVGVPKRFDTFFFLVPVPEGTTAEADQQEGVEVLWIAPADALARHAAGELSMVFPTIRNIEAIAAYPSAGELMEARRSAAIPVTRPVLVVQDGKKTIVIPE
jgi:8-oxo-dGTP pyrophosphatase MutT (NUDIX family)